MDLKDTLPEQLDDLKDWLRRVADPESPPSPLVWAEMAQGMKERALFLEAFVIPKVVPVVSHLFAPHANGTRSFNMTDVEEIVVEPLRQGER